MNKAFRTFRLYLSGNTKITDERLDYTRVQELLGSLYFHTIVGVDGIKKTAYGHRKFTYDKMPAEAIDFIQREFNPGTSFIKYCNMQHQVFIKSGTINQETHYMDLTAGHITGIDGRGNYKHATDKKFTLTFYVDT